MFSKLQDGETFTVSVEYCVTPGKAAREVGQIYEPHVALFCICHRLMRAAITLTTTRVLKCRITSHVDACHVRSRADFARVLCARLLTCPLTCTDALA